MKVNANYLAGYTGWALERLKAQGRQLKEAAESVLDQPLIAIWAVGGIAGDGDFDETSDIELVFEVENPEDADTEYELQLAIESVHKDVGFIQCYIERPDSNERKIIIID
jgi:hypothetical protein